MNVPGDGVFPDVFLWAFLWAFLCGKNTQKHFSVHKNTQNCADTKTEGTYEKVFGCGAHSFDSLTLVVRQQTFVECDVKKMRVIVLRVKC
jgi:hypothetical protein